LRTALLVGSTGLIGKQLLDLLLKDTSYTQVIAISRTGLAAHPKLKVVQTEFKGLQQHRVELKADHIFCCLGTTMRKAKSKEAFRQIDFDYPLTVARFVKENGATKFLLVSALGANQESSIFYNQVKGEVEEGISKIGFPVLHILRPSLLLGPREEQRSGEDAAKVFYRIFGFLIPAKYQGIESLKVARAMMSLAKEEKEGTFIHESIDLQKF